MLRIYKPGTRQRRADKPPKEIRRSVLAGGDAAIVKTCKNDNMNESYSKETIDAKFESLDQKLLTLETKIDGKLDLIVEKIGGLNDSLNARIDGVSNSLGARIDGVSNSLGARIDGVSNSLGARIDGVAGNLSARNDSLHSRLEDLWKVTIGVGGAILVGLLLIAIQNSFEKPSQTIIYSSPPVQAVPSPSASHNK